MHASAERAMQDLRPGACGLPLPDARQFAGVWQRMGTAALLHRAQRADQQNAHSALPGSCQHVHHYRASALPSTDSVGCRRCVWRPGRSPFRTPSQMRQRRNSSSTQSQVRVSPA